MLERKAIPPTTCDYLCRMHLKSIAAISDYMSRGCQTGALNGPQMVCVELINLKKLIDRTLEEYSK